MSRLVEPELLDTLPPEDPRAMGSRRDLRRVNAWMGNHRIMRRALEQHLPAEAAGRLLEIGAGDGEFFRQLVRSWATPWGQPRATLLDMQNIVTPATLAACARLGWEVDTVVADVFAAPPMAEPPAAVVANLFLHHFEDAALARLLAKIAGQTRLFIAVEPHRFAQPWVCGQLLRLIGCNAVTVHDGTVSVRAGFRGRELSARWPDAAGWELTERRSGCFSHLFVARRR